MQTFLQKAKLFPFLHSNGWIFHADNEILVLIVPSRFQIGRLLSFQYKMFVLICDTHRMGEVLYCPNPYTHNSTEQAICKQLLSKT